MRWTTSSSPSARSASRRPWPWPRPAAAPGPGPDPAALAGTASEGRTLERLVVKDGTRVTLVPMAKIDYLQAQDDYVLIKTAEREHLKTQTLSSLEERLDPRRFVRIHRSYIIQLDRLARLEQSPRESWTAILTNGARLPVSPQRLRAAARGAGRVIPVPTQPEKLQHQVHQEKNHQVHQGKHALPAFPGALGAFLASRVARPFAVPQ